MGRRRKPAINFAREAVEQYLLAVGYPANIAVNASWRVPSHLSPEFAGIDVELRNAEEQATQELERAIDRAESELMECSCEQGAERELSRLRKAEEAIRLRQLNQLLGGTND